MINIKTFENQNKRKEKRPPKHISTTHFDNKALHAIRSPKIFNSLVILFLTFKILPNEYNPTVTFKLSKRKLQQHITLQRSSQFHID